MASAARWATLSLCALGTASAAAAVFAASRDRVANLDRDTSAPSLTPPMPSVHERSLSETLSWEHILRVMSDRELFPLTGIASRRSEKEWRRLFKTA